MNITKMKTNVPYKVKTIDCDEAMKQHLFNVCCFTGDKITLIQKLGTSYIIAIGESRFGIDAKLAKSIEVELWK